MLTVGREVDPLHLRTSAGTVVFDRRKKSNQGSADGNSDRGERSVPTNDRMMPAQMHCVTCPLLQSDEGEIGARLEDDLYLLAE